MAEKKGFIHEFKEFISRGNVVDLAVGVIVGGAFTSIVNSLVGDIFTPIIGMILAGVNFNNLGVTIPWGNHPYINIGAFVQSVVSFLLTAFCIFLIVKFINAFKKKEAEKPAEPPKEPEPTKEELLLTEIRDLLKAQQDKE
ncbi:MAG: large-conductance mechanosensitive channel protein MscL [Oscillospiraceae bacterium]